MTDHVCPGPWCQVCVEEALYAGVFDPKEDAMGMALDRAVNEFAEEQRIAVEDVLAESDAEIARAKADGTDHYPGKD
jgi:hypothetical protein